MEHIHPTELVNAMVAICRRSAGLFEDELRRTTINYFGVTRMTPRIVSAVDTAFKQGFSTGKLARTDSGLVVASRS